MARIKNTPRRPSDPHTTWTRFHLPREQEWPVWSSSHEDPYLGPVTEVTGCSGVWLGRKVEDPEKAVFIIEPEWRTAEYLRNFWRSPASVELLHDLPEHEPQASIASSTARLQSLSLDDDAVKNGSSLLWSPHQRYVTMKWEFNGGPHILSSAFWEGRITTTVLEVMQTGNGLYTDKSWRQARDEVLGGFLPDGFYDSEDRSPGFMRHWRSWACVVNEGGTAATQAEQQAEQQAAPPAAGASSNSSQNTRVIWCELRRWTGERYNFTRTAANPEWEEVLWHNPLARELWARAVAQLMPPVTAWEQERWDVRSPPPEDER